MDIPARRGSDLKGIAAILAAAAGLVTAAGAFWTSKDAKSRSDSASVQSATASGDANRTYEVLVGEIKELTDRVRTLEASGPRADTSRTVVRLTDEARSRSPKLLPASLKDLPRALPLEDETDRTGGDFTAFDIAEPDVAKCRQACILDPKCRAFTYARPGFANGRNSPARCFLKATVSAPVRKECCISGVIDRRT
jgi:hypothetical protein